MFKIIYNEDKFRVFDDNGRCFVMCEKQRNGKYYLYNGAGDSVEVEDYNKAKQKAYDLAYKIYNRVDVRI